MRASHFAAFALGALVVPVVEIVTKYVLGLKGFGE